MPQAKPKIASPRLYTHSQLLELRRQMLRLARSLPRTQSGIAAGRLPHRYEAFSETRLGLRIIPLKARSKPSSVPLARHQLQQYGRRTLTGLKRGIEAGEAKFIVDSETTAALRATELAPTTIGR